MVGAGEEGGNGWPILFDRGTERLGNPKMPRGCKSETKSMVDVSKRLKFEHMKSLINYNLPPVLRRTPLRAKTPRPRLHELGHAARTL